MKRNGKIEFLRFLFGFMVLAFHVQKYLPGEIRIGDTINFAFFPHGAMGVEFFFLTSGFLMAANVFKRINESPKISIGESTTIFLKSKITALLPLHLICFVLLFATQFYINDWGVKRAVLKFIENIPSLLFIQMSGFNGSGINHIEWYISVMILSMLIIYPIMKKNYMLFVRVIAPIISIFAIGTLYRNASMLGGVGIWYSVVYRGFVRGFAEICLGTVCFEISRNIQKRSFTKIQKIAFGFGELAIWCIAFGMIMFTVPKTYQFYILLFLALGITLTFSDISYGKKIFNNKFFYFLGKLSLPLYLCQLTTIQLSNHLISHLPMTNRMIYTIIGTFILALVLQGIDTVIKKLLSSKKLNKA